jgi:acetyl esterase
MKKTGLLVVLIALLLILYSSTDLVIIMSGNRPSSIREGCSTPEPGTYLHPLSNLMLVMGDKLRHLPDSVVEKSLKYAEILTPGVRTRIDTVIRSRDNWDIPVRIYNNKKVGRRHNQEVIVFYHGGGFVWGDIKIYDNLCSKIARKTGAVLISVGYRLAPEFPYPFAICDSRDVLEWVSDHIGLYGGNPGKVTVMGDSAGANISVVMSLMSRDLEGPDIDSQVLIYPITMFIDTMTNSRKYFIFENDRDFVLSDDFLERAYRSYLQKNEDRRDPYISPHFASLDNSLPRTLIITAQCDPLRDDGREFGILLREAGIDVVYKEYPGMMHGFVSLYLAFKEGKMAIREISRFVSQK